MTINVYKMDDAMLTALEEANPRTVEEIQSVVQGSYATVNDEAYFRDFVEYVREGGSSVNQFKRAYKRGGLREATRVANAYRDASMGMGSGYAPTVKVSTGSVFGQFAVEQGASAGAGMGSAAGAAGTAGVAGGASTRGVQPDTDMDLLLEFRCGMAGEDCTSGRKPGQDGMPVLKGLIGGVQEQRHSLAFERAVDLAGRLGVRGREMLQDIYFAQLLIVVAGYWTMEQMVFDLFRMGDYYLTALKRAMAPGAVEAVHEDCRSCAEGVRRMVKELEGITDIGVL